MSLTLSTRWPTRADRRLRDFNRFYTSRLGMTRHGLHSTTHPLAEARVLYELGAMAR